jgi:hypothetical protein
VANIFHEGVAGTPADVTQYNENWDLLEAALFDLGPYVISGLVPSAGTGLAVDVTAGTASIGGPVTFAAFSIAGLAPSTLNHLYVLQDGTATSNTTGIAPALSAKLGTATTDASSVTSVDTALASGRQVKVTIASVDVAPLTLSSDRVLVDVAPTGTADYPLLAVGDGGFSGGAGEFAGDPDGTLIGGNAAAGFLGSLIDLQVNGTSQLLVGPTGNMELVGRVTAFGSAAAPSRFIAEDTAATARGFPLAVRHRSSAGAGGVLMGAGLFFEVESTTEGSFNSLGSFGCDALTNALGTQNGRFFIRGAVGGTNTDLLYASGQKIELPQAPAATADYGLLNLGSGGFAGGGGSAFAGSASGTVLAVNSAAAFGGDLLNLQTGGASRLRISGGGALSLFGAAGATQQTVTGARDDTEAALANLLTALEAYGLVVDSTTAT